MSIAIKRPNEPWRSDILFRMPGGEWHVNTTFYPTGRSSPEHVAMVSGASADDLMALAIWADAVHRDGSRPYALIPYLPGARQDRRRPGEALSARVYADVINSCRLKRVACFDPHSDVMPALIDRCITVPSAIPQVAHMIRQNLPALAGVIAPDAGAQKRASAMAALLKVPVFQALKHRDPQTGRLSHFTCEPLPFDGHLVVVDDICDGGGTFKGLAGAISIPRERLSLYVSHGVFSNGAESLGDLFAHVLTTDSHPGLGHEPRDLRRMDCCGILTEALKG